MTDAELLKRIEAAVNDADLADREIPAIDLYLDQILSLVAEKNKNASPGLSNIYIEVILVICV